MRTFPAFSSPLRFLLLFLLGKTSHGFLYFRSLAKALCSPEVLTEAGLRINPNKRIKVGGVVGGDVCIASFGKVFCFLLCFDVQGPDLQLLCSPGRWVWGKNENSALRKQIKMSDQCLHCIYLK